MPARRHPRTDPTSRPRPHAGVPARKGKRRRVIGKLEGNPAVVRGVIVAVLALLTTAGVGWAADVDEATITAVSVVVATVGPLLAALLIRPAVTPNPKVVARVTTEGRVVAGDASEIATGDELDVDRLDVVTAVPVRSSLVAGQ